MKVEIRAIRKSDNPAVERIIKTVMPEFGATTPGFAIHDPEVASMCEAYRADRHAYLVCDVNGQVIGGGGIAPLKGGSEDICELKKMYFLSTGRDKGYGKVMLQACLDKAREFNFKQCYLETFHTMKQAIAFYERNGFRPIEGPLGNTGHFACDKFFILDL